jgi:pimeloyl-ACP methyl ester carboxylesterase
LGHSWGGTLGTATLLKDQDQFLGWIEVGGSNNPKGVYFENIRNYEFVANEQITLGNSIDYWESVKTLILSVDSTAYSRDDFRKLNQETVAAENRLAGDGVINDKNDGADIIFDYNLFTAYWNIGTIQSIEERLFVRADFTDRLPEITIPTLLLWGKYDMVVPVTFGQVAFENIGATSKELVLFERSGHVPMASEPNLFAEKLLLFMNRHK